MGKNYNSSSANSLDSTPYIDDIEFINLEEYDLSIENNQWNPLDKIDLDSDIASDINNDDYADVDRYINIPEDVHINRKNNNLENSMSPPEIYEPRRSKRLAMLRARSMAKHDEILTDHSDQEDEKKNINMNMEIQTNYTNLVPEWHRTIKRARFINVEDLLAESTLLPPLFNNEACTIGHKREDNITCTEEIDAYNLPPDILELLDSHGQPTHIELDELAAQSEKSVEPLRSTDHILPDHTESDIDAMKIYHQYIEDEKLAMQIANEHQNIHINNTIA